MIELNNVENKSESCKSIYRGAFWCSLFTLLFMAAAGYVQAQGTSTVVLDDVSLDTASVLALAAIVLTAIGAIWGIKKLIKLANRS